MSKYIKLFTVLLAALNKEQLQLCFLPLSFLIPYMDFWVSLTDSVTWKPGGLW